MDGAIAALNLKPGDKELTALALTAPPGPGPREARRSGSDAADRLAELN